LYQSVTWIRNINAADRHTRTQKEYGDVKTVGFRNQPNITI